MSACPDDGLVRCIKLSVGGLDGAEVDLSAISSDCNSPARPPQPPILAPVTFRLLFAGGQLAVPVAYGPSHSRRQPPPVLASPKVHVDLYRAVPARVAVAVADRHAAPVDVHPQPVPRAGGRTHPQTRTRPPQQRRRRRVGHPGMDALAQPPAAPQPPRRHTAGRVRGGLCCPTTQPDGWKPINQPSRKARAVRPQAAPQPPNQPPTPTRPPIRATIRASPIADPP